MESEDRQRLARQYQGESPIDEPEKTHSQVRLQEKSARRLEVELMWPTYQTKFEEHAHEVSKAVLKESGHRIGAAETLGPEPDQIGEVALTVWGPAGAHGRATLRVLCKSDGMVRIDLQKAVSETLGEVPLEKFKLDSWNLWLDRLLKENAPI